MRNALFLMISLAMTTSCSVKTNEEKARELIEPEVKANLIKPESYEFAQLQLDSCFSDSQYNPEALAFAMKVAKLYKEYKEYASDAERAESRLTIFASPYGYQSAHSAQQQKKYKTEMEKAQRKAAATKDQIIQLYRDNKKLFMAFESGKHNFVGWAVSFSYRAETAGGLKTMDVGMFYLNKDFTKVTNRFMEEDMRDMQSADLNDLKYEFEDELKDIFGEESNESANDAVESINGSIPFPEKANLTEQNVPVFIVRE